MCSTMIVAIKHDAMDEVLVTYVSAPEHFDVMTERTKWLRWLKEEYMPGYPHIETPAPCEYISLHDWLIRAGCSEPDTSGLREIWDD